MQSNFTLKLIKPETHQKYMEMRFAEIRKLSIIVFIIILLSDIAVVFNMIKYNANNPHVKLWMYWGKFFPIVVHAIMIVGSFKCPKYFYLSTGPLFCYTSLGSLLYPYNYIRPEELPPS